MPLSKNDQKEVKLEAIALPKGKANAFVKKMTAVFDEYSLWKSMKMIDADTTNVNTGRKNGIIIRSQRLFTDKKLQQFQFMGCQLYILDQVLRLLMNDNLGENNTSFDCK